VDVLVKKGLLTRLPSSTDRRVIELALTDAGNALLDTVFRENREWMKERMNGLTTDELATIGRAMEALKKILT
jgi:MarR family transcriptional regulator, 2-MHQ and catechol-resistance regulon repressor